MAYVAPEEKPKEEEKAEPIELDAEKVNELLDVLARTKDDQALMPLAQAARTNLMLMAHDIIKQLEELAKEAREKAEAESVKAKAEADKKAKEEQAQEASYARR